MTKKKTAPKGELGEYSDDRVRVRQALDELGRPESWLAKEAGLSQQHLNRFLNGERKLSPAATDRVLAVILTAFDAKNAADKPKALSPEAAERIRAKASHLLDTDSEDVVPSSNFDRLLMLKGLTGPPRDPAGYETWKTERVEQISASHELKLARTWITHLESQRKELWSELADLREIDAARKEIVDLYKAQVERLKKQLRGVGIEPTE